MKKSNFYLSVLCIFIIGCLNAQSNDPKKPNILIIMVDDVAQNSLSCYTHGMQYPTPNIDRIAKNGLLFTDSYAQPSCTAGRAALITGQLPIRTGLTTVGQPGNPIGLKKEDPTLAELLKPKGYATCQIGKNHLGDRNEHLPTVHGFDQFYGILYHLNVLEEPEQEDYPKSADFKKRFGPRGIIESFASGKEDGTVDPRFGKIGKQSVKDLGPLTSEMMKFFDDTCVARSKKFIKNSISSNKPFFLWFNSSRMHVYTHLKDEHRNLATKISEEDDLFGSGIMEHDLQVGELLDYLNQMGVADNTIVIYTSDNGPEQSTWPHAGTTMFRGEKMTTWEGGVRVPFLVCWPKAIPAGEYRNGITSLEDVVPTIMAAVGEGDVKDKLTKGFKAGDMTYKVHLDGFNSLDYWAGKTATPARNIYYYWYESSLSGIRVGPWKLLFASKPNGKYNGDMIKHTMPMLFNLRKDPFEVYDGETGFRHIMEKSWVFQPAVAYIQELMATFKDFPVRQGAASLDLNKAVDDALKATNN